MVEFIKHLFGACGDGHITIWHILGYGSATFVASYYYMKHTIQWCWKKGCDMCKSKLGIQPKKVEND